MTNLDRNSVNIKLSFHDLFDLEKIQNIQDAFALTTGVASIITDVNGVPITQPSNFCELCKDIIRKTDKGLSNCFKSDASLGRVNTKGPTVQPCLSGGLLDGGTSIMAGDQHVANWLIGQVLDESCDIEEMKAYAKEIGADEDLYNQSLSKITRMSREQFEHICQMLYLVAKQLSEQALLNVNLANTIAEREQIEESFLLKSFVFETSIAANSIADTNGIITEANDAFLKTWGYFNKQDVIGKPITHFFQKSEEADVVINQLNETGLWEGQFTALRKDGSLFNAYGLATDIKNSTGKRVGYQSSVMDISKSKLVEARYQNIVENTDDLITRVDSQGRVTYVNSSSEKYWGLPPNECIGKMAFDFIHPDDRQSTEQNFKNWLNSEKNSVSFENRQIHLCGDATTVMWTITPVRNDQGEILELNSIARDISALKIEERLQNSLLDLIEYSEGNDVKELLQEFLSHAEELTGSGVGFYHFVDEDSKKISLQEWSKNTLDSFCTAEADNLHYPISQAGVWVDAFHQRKPVIHNDYASLTHKKGLPEGHTSIVRELVVPVFRAGKIVAILAVGNKTEDYTETDVNTIQRLADLAWEIIVRKQAENELSDSEEYHRLLYINTPVMMHSISQNGHIVNVSNKWLEKLGYEREEVIGHLSTEFLTEESSVTAKEKTLPEFFDKGFVNDVEYDFVKKNGEIMQTLLSATAEFDDEGKFVRSLAVITDITLRKKLMEEQTRSAQLAALGTVAAGVAHEINNPIQGILNYATLLKNMPNATERTVDISDRMIGESQRIANITKDLLGFARDDRKKKLFSNICPLVESAIDLIEKKTIRLGITIETSCPIGLPDTLFYSQGIQQVVINLIDNATDALLDKDMPITEKIIKISCYAVEKDDQDFLCLEVADNGVGMTKEVLEKAKETFFSTKPSSRGTGLGLSIVNDIVNRHDGEMDIVSVEGEGTKIKLYFPVVEPVS